MSARRMKTAINAETNNGEAENELQLLKSEYEEKIQNYCGDDPLQVWFEYICWVEQCFPNNGEDCSIDELLNKCLLQFENNSKYFQDIRFIKICNKFIDTQENPIEIYQQLYNRGIGTMVSDFYVGWAFYYDLMNNFNKANEIFIKGIDARAQPLDELELAQKTFSLSIPARLLNRDEEDKRKFLLAMEKSRQALTSLGVLKHKLFGSVRTGNIVKPSKAGLSFGILTSTNCDKRVVNVFQETLKKSDDSVQYSSTQPNTYSLMDKALYKENGKEPGHWSIKNNNSNVIQSTNETLAFSTKEAPENKTTNNKLGKEFAIKLPSNFKRFNLPQSDFSVPIFVCEERAFSLPMYDKIMVYPGNGGEYSLEELRAWKYFKKFNIQNQFVLKYDKFWTNGGLNSKARVPPFFPKRNQKQSEFLTESPPKLLDTQKIHTYGWKNYDYSEDSTIEDFLAKKWYANAIHLNNKTVVMNMSLDETVINEADNSVNMVVESNLITEGTDIEVEMPSPLPTEKKKFTSAFKVKCENEEYFQPTIAAKGTIFETPVDTKPTFEIFTNENLVLKADKPISHEELSDNLDSKELAKMEANFRIFEDDQQIFLKEPQCTGTIKKCTAQQIQETRAAVTESDNGFLTEETFSTQNFVLFIEQQGTSTPLQNKRHDSKVLESTENTLKLQQKIMPSETLSSLESDPYPKQLSVILETSETNTVGTSGTTTKSYVEDNESTKYLLNSNNTGKFKTINNDQNLSTIHETSCPRDPSVKDTSNCMTLGLSGLKLTSDSVTFSKNRTTKEFFCEADELIELFSKTPNKNKKVAIQFNSVPLKSAHTSPKYNNHDHSEDELFDFFKKSPKPRNETFMGAASTVLNDSVTIPSFRNILLNNKCDDNKTVTITNVNLTKMGQSIAMPDNQSVMPEFTENMTMFVQQSNMVSFNQTRKCYEENPDLGRYSTKICESPISPEGYTSVYEPKVTKDDEDNLDDEELPNEHSFQHKIIDLNQTRQQIDNCVGNENIDPWNVDLCSAFLEHLDFFNYLEKRDDCELINSVPSLKNRKKIEINGKLFNSIKFICKGAYGFIYSGRDVSSGRKIVLKQERPPNCWEYYISLIITERIFIELLPRFMVINNALIGNNSSIFVSDYAQHGTLLDVCNKIYTSTSQRLNELIVMVLAIELFTIVDLIHSADIIHGDIKPDNFLLMTSLSLDFNRPILKLIDYGNSIDMQRFPPNTEFKTAIKTEGFICSEMQDGRPWTYQTDLYCLAGTLHVLLFGNYMKTENKLGKINIVTKLSRNFHKIVWERIFTSLLNVPDCRSFPNLQDFKLDLKVILADNEKFLLDKILSFNRAIL